jgi:hypothetical protein
MGRRAQGHFWTGMRPGSMKPGIFGAVEVFQPV